MLCILLYSCFFFLFIQNVFDLTISPIKKELDLHIGNDGGLMEDCKVIFVVVVHMYRLPVHFLSFISYFIYTLTVTRVQCLNNE